MANYKHRDVQIYEEIKLIPVTIKQIKSRTNNIAEYISIAGKITSINTDNGNSIINIEDATDSISFTLWNCILFEYVNLLYCKINFSLIFINFYDKSW